MPRSISKIVIDFIPHESQRYPTAGDWTYEGDILHIKLSRTKDPRSEQALAVHELLEAIACNANDISQQAVDNFDMGVGANLDDPGDHPDAPYHLQHVLATVVEQIAVKSMGHGWTEHCAELDALDAKES
jgi:hypothetical protein